jgi:flavin-dependent dehydrogenase
MNERTYDTAIVGGGLAGLTLAINLAQAGHSILLLEKEQYPFHKVCGEYISLESWNYLEALGLPLKDMDLPVIKKLVVTAPGGNVLRSALPLGGFGISRYKIDAALKDIAVKNGVNVIESCKVEDIIFSDEGFVLHTGTGKYSSKVCCGCFGKRSNIDVRWKRRFTTQRNNKLNNYIGVKYHIETHFDADAIALHNFKNGYCGISRIEENKYCLCYLTNAANLKRSGNSIEQMERDILSQNPHLKKIFEHSKKLYPQPLSISQISFQEKSQVENHVLMTGDAAGMITPLCGNGMSMAMHGGKIAAGCIRDFLTKKITREQMERRYATEWNETFGKRLRAGRTIQRFFGRPWLSNLFIAAMKRMPALTKNIIGRTHGEPF